MSRARNWCFTLNNPDAEHESSSTPWLPAPPSSLSYASWQLERGASDTSHVQGYAEFSAPLRLSAVKAWLPSAHWEGRKGSRDQARNYTRKEDSRTAGPWEFGVFSVDRQGERSDLTAAVAALRDGGIKRVANECPEAFVKFSRGLRELAAALEEKPTDVDFVPRAWQQDVIDRLKVPANDRNIIWVVDPVGNKGKSRLARNLIIEHGAILLEGRLADMCYAYGKEPIVIFDISRAAAEHSDHLYSMAEKLKNGMFLSTKYESRQVVFKPPHVIFFSNQMPEESKWSRDRVHMISL